MKSIIIPGEFIDLNTYIRAERGNKYAAAQMKSDMTELVALSVRKIPRIPTPCFFTFQWFLSNKKKDPDNIAFAKKFILDGLVAAKKLSNDGWEDISGFTDQFFVDRNNPRVEIEID